MLSFKYHIVKQMVKLKHTDQVCYRGNIKYIRIIYIIKICKKCMNCTYETYNNILYFTCRNHIVIISVNYIIYIII